MKRPAVDQPRVPDRHGSGMPCTSFRALASATDRTPSPTSANTSRGSADPRPLPGPAHAPAPPPCTGPAARPRRSWPGRRRGPGCGGRSPVRPARPARVASGPGTGSGSRSVRSTSTRPAPDPPAVGRDQHVDRSRRARHALHPVQLQRVQSGDHRAGAGVEQGGRSVVVAVRRRVAQLDDAGQHRPPRPARPAAIPDRGPAEPEPFQWRVGTIPRHRAR